MQKDNINKSMFKSNLKTVLSQLNMYNEELKCIENCKKQMENAFYSMQKHISLKISEIEKIEKETKENINTKNTINRIYKTTNEIMDENNLVKKIDNLFGISKIIAKVIPGDILEFNIFDCSQFSKTDVYVNHIKSLLLRHDFTNIVDYYRDKEKYDRKYYYDAIQINIYSYAKHRSINLYKDLCNKIKDNVIDKIPVKITIKEDMYYINKYISNTSNTDLEIKMQDRKSIEKLKNELNNL